MRILYGSGWSVYAYAGQNSWLNILVPDAILDFQVASLVATIVASFRIAKWTEPVTNALTSIGLTIIDLYGQSQTGKPSAINGITFFFGSYYNTCNILAWYGLEVAVLESSNTYRELDPFAENGSYTWNGSPYDYTQPSGCRVIVNTYPY